MAKASSKKGSAAKASSKKTSSTKYDVIIKAKLTVTRIVDISNDIVRFESNNKVQVNRKHYSRVHWDTVESTMLSDGNATLTIRYLHMTNKGESITGIGAHTPNDTKSTGNRESYWRRNNVVICSAIIASK